MLGLYVSDHPLFGLEHVLARAADCTDRQRSRPTTDRPDGATGHDRRPDHLAAAQDDQERQPLGDRHRRGPRRRHRGAVLPADLPAVSHVLAEDLVVVVRGRVNRRDDVPTIYAQELTLPDLNEGRRGPGGGRAARRPGARRRWSSGSRTCCATHPGPTEVHLRLTQPGRTTVMRLDDGLRVTPTPGAVRRPQGAARSELPRLTQPCTGSDRGCPMRVGLPPSCPGRRPRPAVWRALRGRPGGRSAPLGCARDRTWRPSVRDARRRGARPLGGPTARTARSSGGRRIRAARLPRGRPEAAPRDW